MNEPAHSESEHRQAILFFDGVCGLCNRFVDFVLRADRQHRFRYSPLQGETARRLLGMDDYPSGAPYSFVFLESDRRFEQSNAVLHAMTRLGGAWRLFAVLYVFPRPVRDFVYRVVARNRYRWFGRRDACRMPTPEERDRFLP